MGKRSLSKKQRRAIMADQSRREANPKPITLAGPQPAPAMTKERRKHVVQIVLDMMRPWNQTPFEHEGTIRHGLRSSMCLQGCGWARSDKAAAEVVSEALRIIGVPRPTWEQGQRFYADPRENCKWCYGPIDQADMTAGRSRVFCSDVCARSAYEHWGMVNATKGSAIEREAYRAVYRERVASRDCEQCGKLFTPNREKAETRFCSLTCFTASLRIHIPPRQCENCHETFQPTTANYAAKFCGKKCADDAKRIFQPRPCRVCEATFIPKREDNFFCSNACAHAGKKLRQVEAVCQCCGATFFGNRKDARFCSKRCIGIVHAFKTGVKVPKIISPPVFDFLARRQGARITEAERIAA